MDDRQFAEITRAMGREVTRRGTVARLVGGLAAALAGASLAAHDLDAKKKRGKKRGNPKGRGPRRDANSRSLALGDDTCAECSTPTDIDETDDNNPPCGFRFNVPEGAEFPIEGTYEHTDGDCSCVIAWTITKPGSYSELSFGPAEGKPACSVSQVIVKGGNGYKTYTFDPPALCAAGLVSPDNSSGGPADISHFDFCTDKVSCCKPLTCETVGCTDGPICDGCGAEIDCPCDVCDQPNNYYCDETGDYPHQCKCDPLTCEAVGCTNGPVDDGCCATVDCPCIQPCEGSNYVCNTTSGKCECTPKTCAQLGCGVHRDGCCHTIDCGPCAEGCTPGYWKNHTQSWVGFSPGAKVKTVFATGSCTTLGNATLLQALSFQGGSSFCGGVEILLRAAVAALLNISAGLQYVGYATTADLVAAVNAAIASGSRQKVVALARKIDEANNAGCPCNNVGCP